MLFRSGFNSTVSGLLGYAASTMGAMLVGVAAAFEGEFLGMTFGIKQLLFLLSGTMIVACAFYVKIFMKQPKRHV